MWDHWRGGIFTDSETLNNENELLKCILEKQRKEMMLLAKQIAALTKRKEKIGDKKENCEAEQVSTDWSELGPDEDDQSEVVTWALEAEMITNQVPVPVEAIPAKLAPISTPQPMKSPQSTADPSPFSPMSIVDRTHQCKYCSKPFASATACKRHESSHTDTRPFSCTYCPRAFTRRDLLTMHTRCHTQEKPYICPLCNTGFARSDVRTKHIKTHVKNGECTMAEAKKKLDNVTVGRRPTQNLQKSQQQLQQQSPVPAIINQTPSIPITIQQTDSKVPEPTTISDPLKMVQYRIVQIVPTVQPQFRIEALRKQPRKIAPKRSPSPDPAECSRAVRKTRKLRNIAAKQKRSNV